MTQTARLVIIDFPDETRQELEVTYDMLEKLEEQYANEGWIPSELEFETECFAGSISYHKDKKRFRLTTMFNMEMYK